MLVKDACLSRTVTTDADAGRHGRAFTGHNDGVSLRACSNSQNLEVEGVVEVDIENEGG